VTQRCENNAFNGTSFILPQVLSSPNYPRPYPGGLECLHVVRASSSGKLVTLEIEDLDLEPTRDFVLIRDGESPDSPVLALLSGGENNPRTITTTGGAAYVYAQTDQADSRRGFNVRYYEGCDVTLDKYNGSLSSPAFGSKAYPHNQECVYRVRHPDGGRVSLAFHHMDLHPSDTVEVSSGKSAEERASWSQIEGPSLLGSSRVQEIPLFSSTFSVVNSAAAVVVVLVCREEEKCLHKLSSETRQAAVKNQKRARREGRMEGRWKNGLQRAKSKLVVVPLADFGSVFFHEMNATFAAKRDWRESSSAHHSLLATRERSFT